MHFLLATRTDENWHSIHERHCLRGRGGAVLAASVEALRNGFDGFPQCIRQLGDVFGLGFRERILPFPPQELNRGDITVASADDSSRFSAPGSLKWIVLESRERGNLLQIVVFIHKG